MVTRPVAAEDDVAKLCQKGDLASATTLALETYGPEVLGFLIAILRHTPDATDVFSQFCEDVWRGIGGFRWSSSLRTWMYALARQATIRFARAPHRRRERNQPLSQIAELAERIRSETAEHLKTRAKDRLQEVRARLSADDQALLTLRLDRELEWAEIARVMGGAVEPDTEWLKRESARWRQRFHTLKEQLRAALDTPGDRE